MLQEKLLPFYSLYDKGITKLSYEEAIKDSEGKECIFDVCNIGPLFQICNGL